MTVNGYASITFPVSFSNPDTYKVVGIHAGTGSIIVSESNSARTKEAINLKGVSYSGAVGNWYLRSIIVGI